MIDADSGSEMPGGRGRKPKSEGFPGGGGVFVASIKTGFI